MDFAPLQDRLLAGPGMWPASCFFFLTLFLKNHVYSVYSKLFKEKSDADYTFMNADEEDYPQFGKSDTDPNFVVKEFYGFWQSYFTKRTYVWKEEYDTRDAPNRWVRRKMEQENSKTTEQVYN